MTKPFAGVRILDFTQVFAGPFGCYQLALLGADVIKIERQGGEDMRRSPLSKEWAERNMATAWMAINSNRRNIALDLTKPKAIEIVRKLVTKADVVMENFRPGIMDKLASATRRCRPSTRGSSTAQCQGSATTGRSARRRPTTARSRR